MKVVLEITVLKKARESEITAMRDECVTTYGAECNASAYCMICLVKDDVKELARIFDSSEEKMNFGKSSYKAR